MTSTELFRFVVNSKERTVVCSALRTLQSVLRETMGLTGAKAGCRQGGCGACAVLVDGELQLACLLPVVEIDGRSVETVEGLSVDGLLDPVQEVFLDEFALQCGFCTPGMVMATHALLRDNPEPTRTRITEALSGNLCRCTGYEPILSAVERVIREAETDR